MPIAREVKEVLGTLPNNFHVVKKRDHYFLYDGTTRVACVGNNASSARDYQTKMTLHNIQKYLENKGERHEGGNARA